MSFEIQSNEASHIKKGSYAILNQKPCKIIDVVLAKTGKHGGMKANLVGTDCITQNKCQWMGPGHSKIYQFKPIKNEYAVLDASEREKEYDMNCLDSKSATVSLSFTKTSQSNIEKAEQVIEMLKQDIMADIVVLSVPQVSSTAAEIDDSDVVPVYLIDAVKESNN